MVEVLVTSLLDEFQQKLIQIFRWKELLVLVVCVAAFVLGIPCVMQVQPDWSLCASIYYLWSCMDVIPPIL